MTAARATLTVRVRVRWWVRPLLKLVVLLARPGLLKPDRVVRIIRWISKRGVEVTPGRGA